MGTATMHLSRTEIPYNITIGIRIGLLLGGGSSHVVLGLARNSVIWSFRHTQDKLYRLWLLLLGRQERV